MTRDPRCPSCGHVNAIEATQCAQCNFPLREVPQGEGGPERTITAPPTDPAAASAPVDLSIRRVRPIRPRRPGGPDQMLRTQLWLILGALAAISVLWTAYQGFRKSNATQVVEGAKDEQQQVANAALAALASDSTNLNARIALANVLYDTANWPEAIVHYKSALRLDSARVTTVVDLGVCYYNLSDVATAESLFHRALRMDPGQPVALFNLGIVAENRNDLAGALENYHQAMQAHPPEYMGPGLTAALQRVMQKLGRKAPPLP